MIFLYGKVVGNTLVLKNLNVLQTIMLQIKKMKKLFLNLSALVALLVVSVLETVDAKAETVTPPNW